MRRIMLTVAYDGTAYHGWQRQPDKNSIEDILDQCLTDLTKEPVRCDRCEPDGRRRSCPGKCGRF